LEVSGVDEAGWVVSVVVDVEISNNHWRVVEFLKDVRPVNMIGMGGRSSIAIEDIDDCEIRFACEKGDWGKGKCEAENIIMVVE